MKKFGAIIFFLVGAGLIAYSFPQTRIYILDLFRENRPTGRIAFDDSIKYVTLVAGGISWVIATILNIQSIRLKKLEIQEKRLALEARKREKR